MNTILHPDTSPTAPLAALVYKSRATRHFDVASLGDLVSQAQTRNATEGLTGAVYYDAGRFLQWLEGPSDRLSDVAASISNDRRHTDIELLSFGLVKARMYSDWTMQLLAREPDREIIQPPRRFEADMRPALAARGLASGDERAAHDLLSRGPQTTADAVAQCERIAAAFLPLWKAELCNDVDISIGLSHLLRVFRMHTALTASAPTMSSRRFVVSAMPGEPHFMGAILGSEFLTSQAYSVELLLPRTEQELYDHIDASDAESFVIATSPVFTRSERSADLARIISRLSRARDGQVCDITIYGRLPASISVSDKIKSVSRIADIAPAPTRLDRKISVPDSGQEMLH